MPVLVIDTVVSLTLLKWETMSGQFGGNLTDGGGGIRLMRVTEATFTAGGRSTAA